MRTTRLIFGLACALSGAVPGYAGDIVRGSQLYKAHCVSCHGPLGVSVMPGAPNLARAERMLQSDLALLNALKNGKSAMPAYAGIMTDQQILDVIAYSRTLRR